MTNTQLTLELGGLFLGGALIGGVVGGALVAGYRALDADRNLPRWADMLGVGAGYASAVVAAALLGGYVAPELQEVGIRVCQAVGALGGMAGPTAWPAMQRRLLGYIAKAPGPGAE